MGTTSSNLAGVHNLVKDSVKVSQPWYPNPPAAGHFVADSLSLISAEDRNSIEKTCQSLYKDTGVSIVVATVPSIDLDPERLSELNKVEEGHAYSVVEVPNPNGVGPPVKDIKGPPSVFIGDEVIDGLQHYANCLFNRWGIGSARNSVGMLLLVWKHAPHWNYTVAYGSGWADGEGRTAYMDYELRTLMADQIIPKFKSSEFHLGKTLTSGIAGLATMSRRLWQRQKESSAAMKVVRHSFVPSTGSVGVTPLGPDGMPLPAEEAAATAGAPSLAPTAVTAFLVGGMCAKCQCKVCAPAAAAGLVTPSQAASLTSSVSALSPGTADPTAWQGLSAADEKAAKERLLKHFHKSVLRWPLAPIQGDWYQCVVDTAGLLRPDAIRTITRISEAGLESKRAPVVVVTLQDVAGASHQNLGTRMHRFARDMFNAWGIGEPTFHRGLLLLICKEQSSATVMLGRGWIRSMYDMTDAIIAKTLLPTLEQTRDWSVAISRAVEDLDNLLLAKTNSVPSSSGTQALTPYMGGVTR